ncbi:hypothetical protein [Glaciibacter superstes]|uniref:hypothetical protein n=1 Tax=Glaciibacter superstes TaxID=501023 RepID=UPI0003B32309|nr:hypothetical protein [Glaciibacter superstes]
MADALWWVPSVIVLAIVVGVVVLVIALVRRRSRGRTAVLSAEAKERARAAAISLVRADDLVQSAGDELGFALAQFGERATREFADALVTSRRQLRDAFALQQKLDDAVPDSDDERRRWNEQIIVLADEANDRLHEQTRDFDSRRGAERDAPMKLDQLRRRLDRCDDRIAAGEATLARLALTYAAPALDSTRTNPARAKAALAEARVAADAATAALEAGGADPVGDDVRTAEQGLFTATRLLDAIESGEDQLHIGFSALGTALDDADAELAEARGLRDRHEESDASAQLGGVIAKAEVVVTGLRAPSRLSNPAVDLADLRVAMDGLDVIRSEARNRQLRLENARTALGGAIMAATSQIQVTRDFVTGNRGHVGAAARTRLAEAERQLALAEAEADPVAALDTARRAMTHATDADALARYEVH